MDKEKDLINQIIGGQSDLEDGVDLEFLQDFIVETKEHVENIEMSVLKLEKDPGNQEILNGMFRAFHTIKGLAGFVDQVMVQNIAHQTETLMDMCRKGSIKVDKAVIDLILGSSDYIGKICDNIAITKDQDFNRLVSQHISRLQCCGENNGSAGKDAKAPDRRRVKEKNDDSRGEAAVVSGDDYIRIPTYKVDNLVDMIGELIIIQSLIEQEAASKLLGNDTLFNNLHRMARITKDVQNLSMSLRMISLKSTFQKITRIARDTIAELGKDVLFQTDGGETEIDRSVAEKLLDPMVHLVKNAIYHGIEEQEERIEKGKSPRGQIRVSAYSKRGSVYIEISDDGRGICTDKIYKKAIDRKTIDPNKKYSDKEILDLIFLPGFSTVDSKNVNNISGRGVGMDVVKTEISKIGGRIEINNQPGHGCTFRLKIPINLAVMNGTIVDIMDTHYIIPTLNVKQILQPNKDQWVNLKGRRTMIRVRDDVIPLVPVYSLFGMKNESRHADYGNALIVILELENRFVALPVNNVVGKREIVVKPLGEEFTGLNFVSGASILGDGRVSLILDIENLFRMEGVSA